MAEGTAHSRFGTLSTCAAVSSISSSSPSICSFGGKRIRSEVLSSNTREASPPAGGGVLAADIADDLIDALDLWQTVQHRVRLNIGELSARSRAMTRRSRCGSPCKASPVLISKSLSTRCILLPNACTSTSAGSSKSQRRRGGQVLQRTNPYQESKREIIMSLDVGDRVPDFVLPTDDGGTLSNVNLQGKTTVLYFYPRDDTPGCTTEAQAFRDALPDFTSAGVALVGVSADDIESHRKFKSKYGLNFTGIGHRGEARGGARGLGRKEHVRQEVDGDGTGDVSCRPQRRHPQGLAQGQGARARRRGARRRAPPIGGGGHHPRLMPTSMALGQDGVVALERAGLSERTARFNMSCLRSVSTKWPRSARYVRMWVSICLRRPAARSGEDGTVPQRCCCRSEALMPTVPRKRELTQAVREVR